MRHLTRTAIGMGLFGFGLTSFVYGLAQTIEIGSCGYEYAQACPSGLGPTIVLMVLGAFVAVLGCGVFASRGLHDNPAEHHSIGMGIAVGQLMFWPAVIVASGIAVVLGLTDTGVEGGRPGVIVAAVSVAVVVLVMAWAAVLGARARRRMHGGAGAAHGQAAGLGWSGAPSAYDAFAQRGANVPPPSSRDPWGNKSSDDYFGGGH